MSRGNICLMNEAEVVQRARQAIQRTRVAGDGIPAGVVLAKLRAKVDEARVRRTHQPARPTDSD